MARSRAGSSGACEVLHDVPGRLRIGWPGLRHLARDALEIRAEIENLEWVTRVRVNVLTANVLVHFDSRRMDRDAAVDAVELILVSFLPAARLAERRQLGTLTVQERRLQEEPVARMASRLAVTTLTLLLSRPGRGEPVPTSVWGRLASLHGMTALSLSAPIFRSGLRSLRDVRRPNADTLTATAVLVSVLTGQGVSALAILWLSDLAELLTAYTMARTRRAIRDMLSTGEARVTRLRPDGTEQRVNLSELSPGDRVLAVAGQKISVDGAVESGDASVDQASITGEFMPASKGPCDAVYAGTVVRNGRLVIQARKVGDDTAVARILHLVEEAAERKAHVQTLADRLSSAFIPINFLLSGLVWLVTRDSRRALSMMVVDYSCGVRLSTATALSAAIHAAARRGILIKGSNDLEQLSQIDTLVFDKTGTLTEGRPRVSSLVPLHPAVDERALLGLVGAAEEAATHPVALAILEKIRGAGTAIPVHAESRTHPARGVSTRVDGRLIRAGNLRFMEESAVDLHEAVEVAERLARRGEMVVYVAADAALIGVIGISDVLRENMKKAINRLRRAGMDDIVLLTGDVAQQAEAVSTSMALDRCEAGLLPEHKARVVLRLKSRGARVAMVGDGVNDAPALAYADVGIAIGESRTDLAMEAADITIARNDPLLIPAVFGLADRTMAIVRQNFGVSIGVNTLALVLGSLGVLPVFTTAVIHNACTVIVVVNSSRLLFHDPLNNRW